DTAQNPADTAVTSAAKRLRSEVYAPIEKLGRDADLLARKEREALQKNIRYLEDQIAKTEDSIQLESLNKQLTATEEELATFAERTGDVKFAETYGNRRLHRENVEKNSVPLKAMLRNRYRELREKARCFFIRCKTAGDFLCLSISTHALCKVQVC
ncbi:unnamed protein product, partial [marine sediment metagenome]